MTKWTDEIKIAAYQTRINTAEKELLSCLADGSMGTAKELSAVMSSRKTENGFVWFALLNLERAGMAWRAFDYEDWRSLHRWKITGCGLLFQQTPGA